MPKLNQIGFITILFLLGILILLAGIVGGSFYIKSKNLLPHSQTAMSSVTPNTTPSPSSKNVNSEINKVSSNSSVSVQATGGKVHENKVYKYSIELPNDWLIGTEDDFSKLSTVIISPPNSINYGQENFGKSMLIRTFNEGESTYPVKNQQQFNQWFNAPNSTDDNANLSKIGNTTIDNNPAVQFNRRGFRGDGTEPWYSKVTWVRKNNLNYYIELLGKEDSVKKTIPAYDKVITTFKFTQ